MGCGESRACQAGLVESPRPSGSVLFNEISQRPPLLLFLLLLCLSLSLLSLLLLLSLPDVCRR